MKLVKSNLSWIWQTCPWELTNNWRVQWKKEVRFFTQKWTLSEMLQISHAVLFTWVKQYSACFSPWSLLPFWDNYVCEKHIFLRASSGDLLLNEKQKKPFVSLNHEVTIIHESLTTASLAQVEGDTEWSGFKFVLSWRPLDTRPVNFVFSLFLYFLQKPTYLL